MKTEIKKAKEKIQKTEALIITAGAGMGVDSGLPDFRGNTGFWKTYPKIGEKKISFIEMADPKHFKQNPKMAWAFYGHRLNMYRKTIPHKGFYKLLEFSQKIDDRYFIFTSNVDGQFQKAGFDPNKIVECHGSIHHLQCQEACNNKIWENNIPDININPDKFEAESKLPICPNCKKIARPNILMFGDYNWIEERTYEQEKRLETWINQQIRENRRILVIEIGAGLAIPTVRHFSENLANKTEIDLIRINPRDYQTTAEQIGIAEKAEKGIFEIFA